MKINSNKYVQKMQALIASRPLSEKELDNLSANVKKDDVFLDDEDREAIINLIEVEMRTRFSRRANQLFGPKDSEARDILTKTTAALDTRFNLKGNRLRNGVKTGGHMMAGTAFLDVYISYKNDEQHACSLCCYQVSAKEPAVWRVTRYQTGSKSDFELQQSIHAYSDFDEALNLYENYLIDVAQSVT